MDHDINEKIRAICTSLVEQEGLDAIQVLYTRVEGCNTVVGDCGQGNVLARTRLCETFVLKQNTFDTRHYEGNDI